MVREVLRICRKLGLQGQLHADLFSCSNRSHKNFTQSLRSNTLHNHLHGSNSHSLALMREVSLEQ